MTQKISNVEEKCLTLSDYNKFTREINDTKIKQEHSVDKSDISGFVNDFD